MKTKLGLGFGLFVLFFGAAGGCATATVVEDGDGGTDPTVTDSSVPDTSKPKVDSAPPDTAPPPAKDSAPPDTAPPPPVDAAPDTSTLSPRPGETVDPLAPKPGDPCPAGVNLNDVIDRRCGKCGNQKALCVAGAGGAKVVDAYGACTGEKTAPDACLPRERLLADCGICGKQTKDCDLSCAYVEGACTGQVAGGCTANEETFIEGVCPNPGDVRRQVCSPTCVKGTPEPCAPRPAPAPDHTVTVGAMGVGVTQAITFDAAKTLTQPDFDIFGSDPAPCPFMLSTTATPYRYVRVENPGATARTVTIETTGSTDTMMAYYLGAAPVPTPAARMDCTGQYSDDPGVGSNASLTGVSIPAAGAITVYVVKYSSGAGTTTFRVTASN
ncbi:MAG TPA: hypothetical protein PLR99_18605 [Polyangiaceae bacterium]|nr:hypothetical protein [Polyangiaceae bacterium]